MQIFVGTQQLLEIIQDNEDWLVKPRENKVSVNRSNVRYWLLTGVLPKPDGRVGVDGVYIWRTRTIDNWLAQMRASGERI